MPDLRGVQGADPAARRQLASLSGERIAMKTIPTMRRLAVIAGGLGLAAAMTTAAAAQSTLDRIKQRGQLICGTSQGVAGFSLPDAKGE